MGGERAVPGDPTGAGAVQQADQKRVQGDTANWQRRRDPQTVHCRQPSQPGIHRLRSAHHEVISQPILHLKILHLIS